MELLSGEDVFGELERRDQDGHGPLPVDAARALLRWACRAVHAVHQRGYVHNDFTWENVVRRALAAAGAGPATREAFLIDFGLSFKVVNGQPARWDRAANGGNGGWAPLGRGPLGWGKPGYKAPEQFAYGPYANPFAIDIWPIGVMAIIALVGHHLFRTGQPGEHHESIFDDPIFQYLYADAARPFCAERLLKLLEKWDEAHLVPRDAADFIVQCMQRDPHARATAAQLLMHPFLNGGFARKPVKSAAKTGAPTPAPAPAPATEEEEEEEEEAGPVPAPAPDKDDDGDSSMINPADVVV